MRDFLETGGLHSRCSIGLRRPEAHAKLHFMKNATLRRRSAPWAIVLLAVCLPPLAPAHAAASAVTISELDGDRIEGPSMAPLPDPPQTPPTVPDTATGNAPPKVPEVIHWCAKSCLTLTWQSGRYTSPAKSGTSEWTLDSFTSESFVMRRTETRIEGGKTVLEGSAVLSGRISAQGNRVDDGKMTWTYHPCCGTGTVPFTAAWGAALDTVPGSNQERDRRLQVSAQVQSEICTSFRARLAMQSMEIQMLSDPSVVGLRLMGMALTGMDMSAGPAALIDSAVGKNDGTYTANDPGSFLCAALFVQGDLHFKPVQEGDEGVATLTEAAVNSVVAAHPSFPMWFKVKHLQNDRYQITLLQITWKLSRQYSTEFTHHGR